MTGGRVAFRGVAVANRLQEGVLHVGQPLALPGLDACNKVSSRYMTGVSNCDFCSSVSKEAIIIIRDTLWPILDPRPLGPSPMWDVTF